MGALRTSANNEKTTNLGKSKMLSRALPVKRLPDQRDRQPFSNVKTVEFCSECIC